MSIVDLVLKMHAHLTFSSQFVKNLRFAGFAVTSQTKASVFLFPYLLPL